MTVNPSPPVEEKVAVDSEYDDSDGSTVSVSQPCSSSDHVEKPVRLSGPGKRCSVMRMAYSPISESDEDIDSDTADAQFSDEMVEVVDAMQLKDVHINGLLRLGVDTPEKLFTIREDELEELLKFSFRERLAFRVAKSNYESSRKSLMSSSLMGALPLFRGTEARAMNDPRGFIQRFESVLKASGAHVSRWPQYLLMCMRKPEDSSFWQQHVEANPVMPWKEHHDVFLKHFECFDQMARYVDQVYSLKQETGDSVQVYFDKASSPDKS